MINTDDNNSEGTSKNAPEPVKKGLDLSPTQVIAGGGAAAVASVVGGNLGLGGTVIGAFILSVITAVAVPLFRASLERSHEQLKRVVPRRGAAVTRTAPQEPANTASIRATSSKVSAASLPLEQAAAPVVTKPRRSLPGRARMALGAAAIFVIGLGSVVGVQAATGRPLSNGTATLQSGITQVASNAANTRSTPERDPQPGTKAVVPSTSPTDDAASPNEESTASPAPSSKASPKQTNPAGKATPQPSTAPSQAAPTAGPTSEGDGQADPGLSVATTAPAAK
ncbi:hypothetical protein LFT44_08385 [Arthrobacter sp. FW306-05-C]|uniref:hypothetical protein n=1 Tax=Arthrobacter sp. FW306-05-C TaxID=2879620 RepID=UPI001F455661|nr:hypothetical protein [Arthrobacter sp. FW306-05-C]UKA68388.1 hypothetical protein LFT44_08385 [Arthrobacter sp. FW306-05-C]